ncbi:MAG: ABC transporter substrate-binding protein, partial [Acidimicrobiia bacterium]
ADNVKVAGLHYVNVTPAAMTNAVRSNAIDLAVLSAAEAREVAGSPGFEITVEPTNGIMLLGLLCKSRPPFDDLKVRQALNYGLDRDAINAVVYDGKGESAWGFNNAASPYFDASLKGRYDTDPVKAKQLLAEAGVPNLSFEMFYLPGAEGQSAAEIIQQQWDKIGVKVSLKPLANNADFFPNATGAPITIIPLNRVGIPKITRVLVPGNAGNVCNYDDPELNALVTSLQGVDETSPEGVALWKKISQNGITKAVHVFGLFGTRALAVDESRLGGVTFSENRLGQPTIDTRGVFVKKK